MRLPTITGRSARRIWPSLSAASPSHPTTLPNENYYTVGPYRGTSIMRNSAPLGPYSRNMPRAPHQVIQPVLTKITAQLCHTSHSKAFVYYTVGSYQSP